MKTMLRILLIAGLVALPLGIADADPQVRGLIEIDDEPYFDRHGVHIWTDADVYRIGDPVEITVTVDRPGFVTVYNIDALGRVQRLTRQPRGVWVTPREPLYLPRGRKRLVATGPGGEEELVAVVRSQHFRADDGPFHGDQVASCGPDRDGFVRRTNAALLGRRGRHDGNVARTTFWVKARHRRPPIFRGGGVHIDIGIHIPLGARVYVDGAFFGMGPSVLNRLSPGQHKITVVKKDGRKVSRKVRIPGHDARWRAAVEPVPDKAHRSGSKKR